MDRKRSQADLLARLIDLEERLLEFYDLRTNYPPRPLDPERRPLSFTTGPQPRSMLLSRLPYEIRTKIWRMVLRDSIFALYRGRRRLVHTSMNDDHVECVSPEIPTLTFKRDLGVTTQVPRRPESSLKAIFSRRSRPDSRGEEPRLEQDAGQSDVVMHTNTVTRTSRQIYTECIDSLYTMPTFHLMQNDTLSELKSTIPTHHFDQIRSIVLHYQLGNTFRFEDENDRFEPLIEDQPPWDMPTWKKTFDLLASMQHLVHLHIIFKGDFQTKKGVQRMVQMLADTGVKVGDRPDRRAFFAVQIPWSAGPWTAEGSRIIHLPSIGVPCEERRSRTLVIVPSQERPWNEC